MKKPYLFFYKSNLPSLFTATTQRSAAPSNPALGYHLYYPALGCQTPKLKVNDQIGNCVLLERLYLREATSNRSSFGCPYAPVSKHEED